MTSNSYNGPEFIEALRDYYYLKTRAYPDKFIIKAVGDRYKLSGTSRTLLYRGVFSDSENKLHSDKLCKKCNNNELYIDAYNVIFTLLNYKLGRLVFLSTDRFCRDAGSLFGKIKKPVYFNEAANQLVKFIQSLNPVYAVFFLDSPVSFSKEHCYFITGLIEKYGILGETKLVKSADYELIKMNSGIVCTTDSAIINATTCPVADFSFQVIQYFYKPELLDLSVLLNSI